MKRLWRATQSLLLTHFCYPSSFKIENHRDKVHSSHKRLVLPSERAATPLVAQWFEEVIGVRKDLCSTPFGRLEMFSNLFFERKSAEAREKAEN